MAFRVFLQFRSTWNTSGRTGGDLLPAVGATGPRRGRLPRVPQGLVRRRSLRDCAAGHAEAGSSPGGTLMPWLANRPEEFARRHAPGPDEVRISITEPGRAEPVPPLPGFLAVLRLEFMDMDPARGYPERDKRPRSLLHHPAGPAGGRLRHHAPGPEHARPLRRRHLALRGHRGRAATGVPGVRGPRLAAPPEHARQDPAQARPRPRAARREIVAP